MNVCPYCQQKTKDEIQHTEYPAGLCSNHGKVEVILLFNKESEEVEYAGFVMKTNKYDYYLFLRHKLNNTTLEIHGKEITLACQIKTIFDVDYIVTITPEEFPDRLKLWLNFY